MRTVYKILRDIEWIQSLVSGVVGAGGMTTLEVFWNDVPLWAKFFFYTISMTILLEVFRRRKKPHFPDGSVAYSDETLLQLERFKAQRRKEWMDFVGRHMIWIYLALMFFILWILRPLLALLGFSTGDE